MKGKSISGSVLDVSKGYTKLHLEIDQSQDSSQGEWFVQPSFYTGSGGYCAMPERGDVLSLHFPTEDERDCYIISAQGASSESLYNQISSAAADSQTSSPGSGVRTSCKGGIDCWERASVVMWRKQPPNAVRER